MPQEETPWPSNSFAISCFSVGQGGHLQNDTFLTDGIDPWLKALAANSDDLRLIPRLHVVEEENPLLPTSVYMHHGANVFMCPDRQETGGKRTTHECNYLLIKEERGGRGPTYPARLPFAAAPG